MDPLAEQAARRVDARKKKAEDLAKEAEQVKNTGNEQFRRGDYFGAANAYVHAMNHSGPTPVILSNLAAAYFKLNYFEESLWAATTALEYDPRFLKARFRRAMARKQLFLYKAAVKGTHLEAIIAEQPDNEAARQELKAIRNMLQHDEGLDISEKERDHPRPDAEPWETYMDSDTEDSRHTGNSITCRFYNHGGCTRGNQCQFSHAPDDKSIRDELGKNVCLQLLFGTCPFGDAKCIYSHDKRFLPAGGWWNDPAKVHAAKTLQSSGKLHDITGLQSTLIKTPKANSFAARREREAVIERLNSDFKRIQADVGTATPRTAPPQERFVLLLSFEEHELFHAIHTHLLATLRNKIKIVEVRESPDSIETALRHLTKPNLASVLLTDPAIVKRKYTALAQKLVEYVKNGGSVAMAGQFSNHVRGSDFDKFMKNSWGLGWKYGSYHRTTFKTNPANQLVRRNPSLAASYSMKTLHVAGIQPEMAIYVPTEDARLQSLVFPPSKIKDTSESPAVCTRVGRGLLSFLGDVNGENDSTNTILAMLGLLDEPNVPLAPSPLAASTSSAAAGPSNTNGTSGQPSTSSRNGKGKKKEQSNSQANSQQSENRVESTGYAVVSDDRVESTGYTVVSEDRVERTGIAIVPEDLRQGGITIERSSKFVLIVAFANADMFARIHAHQISALKEKVDVKTAETAAQAVAYLTSPDICGVYIADEGITRPSNSLALAKIVDYIKAGGQAVIGGLFPSMTTPSDITKTLTNFGVPWRKGSYSRTEAVRNGHHEAAVKNPSLSEGYSMKAVHLTGFHAEDLFYEQYPQNTDDWEAPILRTRLGKGHLGYIGDVNAERETTDVVLAMLELLTPKRAIVPDSKKFFMILTSYDEEFMTRFLNDFIKDAKKKAEVLYDLSNARVIDLLPSRDLLGILITDPYILYPENEYLLSKVVEYSKNGGTVVFGSMFARQVTLTQFRPLFRDNWGLDWDFSIGPQDAKVAKNPKNSLAKKMDELKVPKTFEINGIYVRGIAQSMAVYIPQNRPNLWKPADNNFRSSIIYTDIEKGHLGFIGVNSMNDEIRTIFYAMIGLI